MTTRIRINEQGQITETREVNAISINGQNRPTADYPAEVIRDADGGGWLIPVMAEIPEGAVAHVVEWEQDGIYARQIVHEYWTAEEIAAQNAQAELDAQAQAQMDRYNQVLAMTDAYGGMVAALGHSLLALGHEIPVESAVVMADLLQRSLGGLLTPEQERAKGDVADIYIILQGRGITDDDIAAVWSIVRQA